MENGGLINLLFLFTIINIILSILAIFIKAAKTGRYEQALIYLEERNNGTFNNFTFDNCEKGGMFKTEYYCDIYGKRLSKPEEKVDFQSIFKNWGKIEIITNTSRAVIDCIYIIFLYFVIKRRDNNAKTMNTEQQEKYLTLINYLITFISFLIAVNIACILIRASSIMANNDIGLYEDGNQNSFEEKTAINYIFDIIQIILYCIEICFSIRLKTVLKKNIFVVVIINGIKQNDIHIQQNINVNNQLTMNDNHNNYIYINSNYNNNNYYSNNYNSNNYINKNINNINNNDNNNNNIEGRDKYEASVNLPFKPV